MKGSIPQHKRMAMGSKTQGYAKGGSVMPKPAVLKSGKPDTPIEKAKRANGIVGMNRGGKVQC